MRVRFVKGARIEGRIRERTIKTRAKPLPRLWLSKPVTNEAACAYTYSP